MIRRALHRLSIWEVYAALVVQTLGDMWVKRAGTRAKRVAKNLAQS